MYRGTRKNEMSLVPIFPTAIIAVFFARYLMRFDLRVIPKAHLT